MSMVISKILGGIDIFIALVVFLSVKAHFIPEGLLIGSAIYLVIKGGLFLIGKDIASAIDLISGILILISVYLWIMPNAVHYFIAIFLAQKGIFSMIG